MDDCLENELATYAFIKLLPNISMRHFSFYLNALFVHELDYKDGEKG